MIYLWQNHSASFWCALHLVSHIISLALVIMSLALNLDSVSLTATLTEGYVDYRKSLCSNLKGSALGNLFIWPSLGSEFYKVKARKTEKELDWQHTTRFEGNEFKTWKEAKQLYLSAEKIGDKQCSTLSYLAGLEWLTAPACCTQQQPNIPSTWAELRMKDWPEVC